MSEGISTIAPLPNVAALQSLVDRTSNRHPDLPGMATFYGPSGDGKSFAGTYVMNSFDAVLVQAESSWTKKDMLVAMHEQIGLSPKGTINAMSNRIAEHLAVEDRALIVDEADYLVQKKMIEVLRDIYEKSRAPVILIGEESLPQKLKAWERIHNRMLDWVATEPGTLDDLFILAPIYAQGVEIDRALASRILKDSHASIRRVCVNLNQVQEFARLEGLSRVTLEDWGQRHFFTGRAPDPRGGTAARAGRVA